MVRDYKYELFIERCGRGIFFEDIINLCLFYNLRKNVIVDFCFCLIFIFFEFI